MQRETIVKGRSLGGASDLTLLAPIKPGFITSLESVTYKTRIKRVLETLHIARMSGHEYHNATLLSDSVERVGAIQSVRVAVLEPEDKVLLAVTFDGSWTSYIRLLWEKVGPLLDLIFYGTEDYVLSSEAFGAWVGWANRVQVETSFFYAPASTAFDVRYHRRVERLRTWGGVPGDPETELDEVRAVMPSAEDAVERFVRNKREGRRDDPATQNPRRVGDVRMVRERMRLGLEGLAGLYRLVDLHPQGTDDGKVLRAAAISLLREFVQMHDDRLATELIDKQMKGRFARQLRWLFPSTDAVAMPRPAPKFPPDTDEIAADVLRDAQGGIVETYGGVTRGVLVLLCFADAATATAFLGWATPLLTRAADPHRVSPGGIVRNLALTFDGLRACGVDEDLLEMLPEEFRQGMAARCGLLGDVRANHPRRWELPVHVDDREVDPAARRIEMQSVHAVLQLRINAPATAAVDLGPAHPLDGELAALRARFPDSVLAVQPLSRHNVGDVTFEHFGFADGDGQPQIVPRPPGVQPPVPFDLNRVLLGEVLLGHPNTAERALDDNRFDPSRADRRSGAFRFLLTNGSFLVLRKYRQFVDRLDEAVTATAEEMVRVCGAQPVAFYKEVVYGKLVGRRRDGEPLAPHASAGGSKNNFTYARDQAGTFCPLHAHIRRAHPRKAPGTMARPPRIVRRGMSYGSWKAPGSPADDQDRGNVFMAYNASLSEQFEVVQRWLSGGNSTGVSSGGSCPIVGVPENGLSRNYRFEYRYRDAAGNDTSAVFRVRIEDDVPPFEPAPLVTRLLWGLYAFTPSMSALAMLQSTARDAASVAPAARPPWQVAAGRVQLAKLRRLEAEAGALAAHDAWKAAIEDAQAIDRLESAALWAAIRADHGGVLRTPYGVLVADRELASAVYVDPHDRYSVCGQFERMKRSFGEISLGLDRGPRYEKESQPINDAILKLKREDTYAVALQAANAKLDAIRDEAIGQARQVRDARYQVTLDVREVVVDVLKALCDEWFGLVDDPGHRFVAGDTDWSWTPDKPPPYPGHFTAMSRYMFQPHPGELVAGLGEQYGQALRAAMNLFVARHKADGTLPSTRKDRTGPAAPIAKAIFEHKDFGSDVDFIARNMVGVLMGFNPTITGAVMNVVRELQRDGVFNVLRVAMASSTAYADAERVLEEPLARAARMRPMPQIGWRTAVKAHRLGDDPAHAVEVAPGDIVVIGIVSGTQQSLEDGRDDRRLMFGEVRKPAGGGGPTHGCPGYEAAIGAIWGTVAALVTRAEAFRPGAAPLVFVMEGPSGPFAKTPPLAPFPAPKNPTPPPRPATRNMVLAWGDSWLDFRHPIGGDLGFDLRDWLEKAGYEIAPDFCNWVAWPKIVAMSQSPQLFRQFIRDTVQTSDKALDAILLSGGGNDSTGTTLKALLLDKATSPRALDAAAADRHVAMLQTAYSLTIANIRMTLADLRLPDVPIIVHGYVFPYARGKEEFVDWLDQPFQEKGWDRIADRAERDLAMRVLITKLNAMQAALPGCHHVDFKTLVEDEWPNDRDEVWANDLHPKPPVFEKCARLIDEAILAHRPP